jgi:tetratricopeptide (TPR) repeat protein
MWSETLVLAAALILAQARGPDRRPDRGPAPRAPEPGRWWNENWTHRRTLTVTDQVRGSHPEGEAVAEVPTLGVVNPDGSDLRVVNRDGKEMKVHVLASGDEDRALVAFEAPARGEYTLYFGNPAARPGPRLDFRAGLMMEVRALGPGDPKDWSAMQRILEASPKRTGRWWWPNIAIGFNPLGPWDNGIFLFTGYLHCPADGVYTFAVNSIDASFLLVDGRPVAEWPGWHPASGGSRAGHRGTADLKKGVHRIEVINAFRAHGALTVGWQRPDAQVIVPIPPEAFAGYYVAKAGPAEARSGPAADFEWTFQDDLGYEGRKVTVVRFLPLGRPRECSWDFGDGVKSQDLSPSHLYLEAGTYTVAAEMDGKKVSQRVQVQPVRGHGGKAYEKRIPEYAARVQEYPTANLSAAACFELGLVCHEGKRLEGAVRGWKAALEKGYVPQNPEDHQWIIRLWEICRDDGKYEDALWVCDRILDRKPPAPVAVQALLMKAEILYDGQNRAADAEACCRKVLDQFASAPSDYVRWAYIRSGEFALLRGDREGARKILEDAERSDKWRRWKGDFQVSEGAHSINFEEYLRQKDFETAFKEIQSWTWAKPTEVLSGLPRHLRGRVFLLMKKPEAALREFDRALAADPKSPFADEALYFKGEALEALKKTDDAKRCYEKIVYEFPESTLAPKAKEKVK